MMKKIKYNLLRNYYAKQLTGKMGKIEIKDDKIICHVSMKGINQENNEIIYYISLYGSIYYDDKLKDKYDLNKPIYYIFDDITFNKEFMLHSGPNTHVIIRNCTFNNTIEIIWCDGEITFENNTYNNCNSYYFNKKIFFGCKAKKLNFINDVFMDTCNNYEREKITFGISAKVDELKIHNSFICISDDSGKIWIDAKDIRIKDSIIDSPNIELKSNVINIKDSRITADKEIIIDNEMNNGLDNIEAKEILYNGVLIKEENNEVIDINKETINIAKKRNELINLLNNIKTIVNEVNVKKIKQVKNNLETKELSKILKLK